MQILKHLKAQSNSIKVLPMDYATPTHWYSKTIDKYNAAIDAATESAEGYGDKNYKPKSKLPTYTTLHGLRHTSATLLIAQGMDIKTVSSRLGHSSTTVTLNTYTHALKKRDELASDALQEAINIKFNAN